MENKNTSKPTLDDAFNNFDDENAFGSLEGFSFIEEMEADIEKEKREAEAMEKLRIQNEERMRIEQQEREAAEAKAKEEKSRLQKIKEKEAENKKIKITITNNKMNNIRTIDIKFSDDKKFAVLASIKASGGIGEYNGQVNIVRKPEHIQNLKKFIMDYIAVNEPTKSVEEVFLVDNKVIEKAEDAVEVDLNSFLGIEEKEAKVKELKEEKTNRVKESAENDNAISIFEQERNYNEKAAQAVYRSLKGRLLIDESRDTLNFYDYDKQAYTITSEREIKKIISAEMEKIGIIADNTSEGWKACLDSFPIYAEVDGLVTSFIDTQYSIKVIDKQGDFKNVLLNLQMFRNPDDKKKIDYKFVIEKAAIGSRCNKSLNAKLKISNIITSTGKTFKAVDEIDFDSLNENIFYIPRFNKDSEVYNMFLKDALKNEEHIKLLKIFWGSIFCTDNLQSAIVGIGNGGDGKGVFDRITDELFGQIKGNVIMNGKYTFDNANIDKYTILTTQELARVDFKETFFKRLTGEDKVDLNVKNKDGKAVRFKNILLAFYANPSHLMTLSDTGRSMIRRFNFVQWMEADKAIPNFDDLLINGGIIDNSEISEDIIEVEGGACDDMLEFFLEGALELKAMRGFNLEKIGPDVVEFKKEILGKMITSHDFFKDFPIRIEEGKGMAMKDMYEFFMNDTCKTSYSLKSFTQDIANYIKTNDKFKKEYGNIEIKDNMRIHVNVREYNYDTQRFEDKKKTIRITNFILANCPDLPIYKANQVISFEEMKNSAVQKEISTNAEPTIKKQKLKAITDTNVLELSDVITDAYDFMTEERKAGVKEIEALRASIKDVGAEIVELDILKDSKKGTERNNIIIQIGKQEDIIKSEKEKLNSIVNRFKADYEEYLKKSS